jgi:hypothetical protein
VQDRFFAHLDAGEIQTLAAIFARFAPADGCTVK